MGDFQRINWLVISCNTTVIWVRLVDWLALKACVSEWFCPIFRLSFRSEELTLLGWWERPAGIDQLHTFKTGCGGFLLPWLHSCVPPTLSLRWLTRCFLFKFVSISCVQNESDFIFCNFRFIFEIWVKKNCLIIAFRKILLFWC